MNRYREDAGRRLLPHIIDELSEGEPERILYELTTGNDVTLPPTKVTARDYANAINRASWWLRETLGKGENFPTVGYTGPQDIRYFILLVSAIKVGYKMLYTSPRNTVEGDVAVVRAANCNTWLVPSRGSNVQRLLGHVQLRTVSLPDLEFFIDPEPVLLYDYQKSWESGRRDPSWVLHTSGSTGNPKPVVRFLDSVASVGANNLLPKIDGRPLLLHDYYDSRAYLTFPLYHGAGLVNGMLWPLFHGTTIIFGPEKPVSLDVMKQVVRHTKPDAIFTAPSIVEEISKDDQFLALLSNINALAYGGGPVSIEAGNRIWQHTKLRLSIGTTETGWLPCVETDPEDWNYIHLHPGSGFELQDRGGGLHELVAVRRPGLEQWQPIFSTFPDLQEHNFKDLFSKHPKKPDLYKYEGRADNVLVLSNGEKVQPHDMELIIGAHPLVRSAVVAGQGRFQASAIVEVLDAARPTNEVEHEDLLKQLGPSIEAANKSAPTHAKLHRDFILIASPRKPFPRTSKSTVRRGPTLQLYEEELNGLYSRTGPVANGAHRPLLDFSNESKLKSSLRQLVLSATEVPRLGDDEDFFATVGMDSLQVLTLRRLVSQSMSAGVGAKDAEISTSLIYGNPTITLLSKALLRRHQKPFYGAFGHDEPGSRLADEMLSKYSQALDPSPNLNGRVSVKGDDLGSVVVLTGSTGSLGSYLLNDLIQSRDVREIWCLNRSADAPSRQLSLHSIKGLSTDFQPQRVYFRHANLSEDQLGLSRGDYQYLTQNLTHIIHTQWQVDFNLALPSFEPHIRGVRNLVNLAQRDTAGAKDVKFFFSSSVGVANSAKGSQTPISEAPLTDWASAGRGYGESKLVAERLMLEAAEKSGVNAIICRIGQIAGPVKEGHQSGQWNVKEWLPSIITASAYMSLVPETLGHERTTHRSSPVPKSPLVAMEYVVSVTAGSGKNHTLAVWLKPCESFVITPTVMRFTATTLPASLVAMVTLPLPPKPTVPVVIFHSQACCRLLRRAWA